jgi:uncharacterized caspase-like protein
VEDINAFRDSRDIENSVFELGVDSYLTYARPNARHRAPIGRLTAELHEMELMARLPSGIRRECPHVDEG